MDEERRAYGALEEAVHEIYDAIKEYLPAPEDIEGQEYERQIWKQHQRDARQEIRARRRSLCPRKATAIFHRRLLPGKSGGRK